MSETVSVAGFKAVAIGIVFRLLDDFSTCLPHGLLNWKCWHIVSFPIHDILQRISLWLAKKIWVSVQVFYSVERCFSCVLSSLTSFVNGYVTTVTLAPLQTENRLWNRWVGVCNAAYWWVLMKCRTEPRKERTKCPLSSKAHLDLSSFWLVYLLEDLSGLWGAEEIMLSLLLVSH